MASAQPETVPVLTRFLATLGHLGWGLSHVGKPRRLESAGRRRAGSSWVPLALPDGQLLVLLAQPDPLPNPAESFQRFEDLAIAHRTLARDLETEQVVARYVLLLGGDCGHLVDLVDEDVLLAAEGREELDERLLPLLDVQSLTRGSLAAFPRKPLRQRARELAAWVQLWSTRLGGRLEAGSTSVNRFFEWLLLSRVAELSAIGPPPGVEFAAYPLAPRPPAARRFLESRFTPLHDRWNLFQDGQLHSMLGLAGEAERTSVLGELLSSFGLLSRSKFTADVFAEAFADEDLRVLGWRSAVVAEPLRPGDSIEDVGRWIAQPCEVDIDSAGLPVLLQRFDELTNIVKRHALDTEAARDRGERPGLQLDLLGDSPIDIRPHEAARHVARSILAATTSRPDRAILARLVLASRCCDWYGRLDSRDLPIPSLRVRATTPPGVSEQPSAYRPSPRLN